MVFQLQYPLNTYVCHALCRNHLKQDDRELKQLKEPDSWNPVNLKWDYFLTCLKWASRT